MFESITDPEHRSGLRGFFARHFSPVTHADVAKDEVELLSSIFMFIAGAAALFIALSAGLINTAGPIILAVLAGLLRVSVSRVAAVILLTLTGINALLHFLAPTTLIPLLIAARATQLTFAYHRLTAQQAPSAQPPNEPASSGPSTPAT